MRRSEGSSQAEETFLGSPDIPMHPTWGVEDGPGLKVLWEWQCEATQGLTVTSMAWNYVQKVRGSSRYHVGTEQPGDMLKCAYYFLFVVSLVRIAHCLLLPAYYACLKL